MYKKKSVKKLGKRKDQRVALIKSQLKDLITHTHLKTTRSRAKVVARELDLLVPFAKERNLRHLFNYLRDKEVANKLIELANSVDKTTGYVTMVGINNRPGDNAERVLIELVSSKPKKNSKKTEGEEK